jgi:CHASE2 domain-containing sensor protein
MALSRDLVYGTKAASDLHRNQTVHVAELEGSQTRVGFSVTVADQARQHVRRTTAESSPSQRRADTHTSCQGPTLAGHMISVFMVHSFEVQPTLTPYRQPTEPVHEYSTRRL